ncbi:hypothetical protein ABPG73_012407 [Tetrahymena malaccensis]
MENQREAQGEILTNCMKFIQNEEHQQLNKDDLRDVQSYDTENYALDTNKLETQQNQQDSQLNNETKFRDTTEIQYSEDKNMSENTPNSGQNDLQSLMIQSSCLEGKFIKDYIKQEQHYNNFVKSQSLFSQSHERKQTSEREISLKPNGSIHKQIHFTNTKDVRRATQHFSYKDNQTVKKSQLLQKIKKRMINFYQNFTNLGKRIYLEKTSVHTTLNDKSDGYFENQHKITVLKQTLLFIKLIMNVFDSFLLSKIPVISAQSRTNMLIKSILIVYNSFFFLLLSIMIVFQSMLTEQDLTFYRVTLIIWTFEILIRLNTTTYKDSNILTNRKDIFFSYFPKKFICDFISFLLIIILLLQDQTEKMLSTRTIIQILCFAKILILNQDIEEFQKRLCMMLRRYYLIKLSNLIIKLFILAHTIACGWFIIATIEIKWLGEQTTWYTESAAADGTWWKVYILSMYWALTLMTTGSNQASTILQVSFTSFIMLFTTIIIGYLLNATGAILEEIDASEENKRNDLNIINEYMREKNISINLQGRVNIYLEYYYQKNYQKQTDDAKNVLSKISTELRNLLQKEYFQHILTRIDFLHKNFSTQSLANLSIMCEEIVYYPNQIIFEENDFTDAALLVIIEGQVEIYQQVGLSKKDQKTICFLGQGQIIGQINFFTGMVRTASARSRGFTKLAKISRDSFLSIVKENEKDLQTFYQMKDNILLYENYEQMNIRCSACSSYKHLQGSCPLVHLSKQNVMEKVRILNIMKQDRKQIKRHTILKRNALKNIGLTQAKIAEYQDIQLGNGSSQYKFLRELEDDEEDDDNYEEEDEEEEEKNFNENNDIEEESSYDDSNQSQLENNNNQAQINDINNGQVLDMQKNQQKKRRTLKSNTSKEGQGSSNQVEIINPQFFSTTEQNRKKSIRIQSQSRLLLNNFFQNDQSSNTQQFAKKKRSLANTQSSEMQLKQRQSKDQNHSRVFTDTRKLSLLQNNMPTLGQFDSDSSDEKSQKKKYGKSMLYDKNKQNQLSRHLKFENGLRQISFQQFNSKMLIPTQSSQRILEKKELEDFQEEKERVLWQLDKQKDYEYYFNHGNMKIRISQFNFYLHSKEQKYLMQLIQNTLLVRKKQHRISTQLKYKKNHMKTQIVKLNTNSKY